MTSLFVDDFKLGLDTRRSILTAQPGSLRTLDNCVITAGGEIQKRKAFVKVATLPDNTKGLEGTTAGSWGLEQLYTFSFAGPAGTTATLVNIPNTAFNNGPIPIIAAYLQSHPDGLLEIVDAAEYGAGQFFVAAWTGTPGQDPTFLLNYWKGILVPAFGGIAPLVSGQKMYRVAGSILYFSGVGDPSVTNPLNPAGTGPNTVNPGAGFIDMAHIDSDALYLIGTEAYYKQVAIFSRRVCLLYNLDPDPTLNAVQQVLRIGAVSNRSILQFGTGDVLFLSDSGVRSLRVLNLAQAAGVTDVGSPIDNILQVITATNPNVALAEAIVEPISGRYWLAIGNTIYVLSYWPSAKISAWSTFTLPFGVNHMTVAGSKVFIRSGNDVYLYGGINGVSYDNSVATVRTPHMSADTPTTYKKAVSIGAMATGNWAVNVGMQTDNPDFYELVANITGDTYSLQQIPFSGYGTHFGFTLTCSDAAPAILGALTVNFEPANKT
jgi:hypothetical protein